jgi:hypothetical protein
MSPASTKPVIFISYSHKDEPERTPEGDIHWLNEIQDYLAPATNGVFDLWTDEDVAAGVDWEKEIQGKLAACDICILLVSRHSLASKYVIDTEIATIHKRQGNGDDVQIYPIALSPIPQSALPASLAALNIRPRLDKPLSGFSRHDRGVEVSKIADEIVGLLGRTAAASGARTAPPPGPQPAYVHVSGLPETAYERLVGREAELKRLDDAWTNSKINILSLVAEGGAGKSALVNEWLTRLQADNYRGADAVLGWSFYSQGSKERATSADAFLDWAVSELGAEPMSNSAVAKAEAIAEAMIGRRALLVLDGVEPLQHGPDGQIGQLKDQGLRALLRRFVLAPPAEAHSLIVLTSRLPINDIGRWKDTAAPVVDVEKLSDKAGAALLRDNGVWGTDKELRAAAHEFGGHPLALGLLASFLKETQTGDARRRDHIRTLLADVDNPGHDHAARVMESYEKDWLAGQPALLTIMQVIGLFDRPASGDCLKALRAKPAIKGLTDAIVKLDNGAWRRAVARLREVRLLAPLDPTAPDALDTHPLVREWFGARLRQTDETAWRAAHSRLYDHLRRTTKEGAEPTLSDLAPLYQAIAHGCRAGRHQEALHKIYVDRICRWRLDGEIEFYTATKLGAVASDLAVISWFFDNSYEKPSVTLNAVDQSWVRNEASLALCAQGRNFEALPPMRVALHTDVENRNWLNAAIAASNLSDTELLVGAVAAAVTNAEQSVSYADRSGNQFLTMGNRTTLAQALHAAGQQEAAERLLVEAELRQKQRQPGLPLLYSFQGYRFCDLLLSRGDGAATKDRATKTLEWAKREGLLIDIATDTLMLGRANFGLAAKNVGIRPRATTTPNEARSADALFDTALEGLRASGDRSFVPRGLLARAAFRRSVGRWSGTASDLDEVEEIAEPAKMRLYLCDLALERARLVFARLEAFAPLNGLVEDGARKLDLPDAAEASRFREEAAQNLATARKLIADCGYHRRDEELAELEDVAAGRRRFAELPPRV